MSIMLTTVCSSHITTIKSSQLPNSIFATEITCMQSCQVYCSWTQTLFSVSGLAEYCKL